MDSFWAKTHGCQAEDCYELLRALRQDRKEILGVEAARFLGFDLEVIQPLLQRLVEEGLRWRPGKAPPVFIAGPKLLGRKNKLSAEAAPPDYLAGGAYGYGVRGGLESTSSW